MLTANVQRLADTAHFSMGNRPVMGRVQLHPDDGLPFAGHHVASRGAERFRQHGGSPAVQQAKRLKSTVIHRHFRFKDILSNTGIYDPKVSNQRIRAGCIQLIQRVRAFPVHLCSQR
ncbi:hypothetical protein BL250_14515 [Erwinia sp. OLTSP20]|nr:hypothetical protein BL250_14515 [Erwinia sp. OLTSP20]